MYFYIFDKNFLTKKKVFFTLKKLNNSSFWFLIYHKSVLDPTNLIQICSSHREASIGIICHGLVKIKGY
jgi:hypothetical protein